MKNMSGVLHLDKKALERSTQNIDWGKFDPLTKRQIMEEGIDWSDQTWLITKLMGF